MNSDRLEFRIDEYIKKENQDVFCIEPWRQVHFDSKGRPGPCCNYLGRGSVENFNIGKYLNSPILEELKNKMRKGVPDRGCVSCYKHEYEGKKSMRQRRNKRFGVDHSAVGPNHLMLTLGNLCNAACRMCNPSRSSKIASDYLKISKNNESTNLGFFKNQLNTAPLKDVWRDEKVFDEFLEHIACFSSLEISGGEPLIYPQFKSFLQKVCERTDPSKIELSITTNTTNIEQHAKLISKFKRVSLSLSIDSIGEQFELIRWPLKWKNVNKSVKFLESFGDNVDWTFVCVPMNLNLLSLPDTLKYFIDNGGRRQKRFMFSHLNSKFFYHPSMSPRKTKESVLPQLSKLLDFKLRTSEKDSILGLINEINVNFSEEAFEKYKVELLNYSNLIDMSRKQNTWASLGWHPRDLKFSSHHTEYRQNGTKAQRP